MPEQILTKICCKCKNIKPTTEFRNRAGSRSQELRSECKECSKACWRKWRNSKSGREYFKKYQEEKPERFREAHDRYEKRNPEKQRVRKSLQYAIRSGKIQRATTCFNCGVNCKPEAHHHKGYDWDNRFDVQWLCRSCHGIR